MTPELHSLLCTYLGELLNEEERTFDWIETDKLKRKLNAVYVLLDIEKREKTFMEAVKEAMDSGFGINEAPQKTS